MQQNSADGRICIVANELSHLFRNGGIGTHNWLLAETLAAAGWNVHILYCADIENAAQLTKCRQLCNAKGISLWHLPEFAGSSDDNPPCGLIGALDQHSLHIRRALEQLDAKHCYDLIEFGEWSGYAFRTVQANTMGVALTGPRIIVRLHASSQWCRDANREWLASVDDLIRDYFERYSFEHANYQLSPSRYMLEYAASIGWKVSDDARVSPYCNPTTIEAKALERHTGMPEVVFFGRLEVRKGLKVFLDMAQSLPPEIPVSFLGKELYLGGIPAAQMISNALGERPFIIHSNFDRQQALAYLSEQHRIAVMPSLIENYPFTVLECAAEGVPFLAANVGGIPEIVADRDLQKALLFEPTPRALRQKLDEYLVTDPVVRHQYTVRMQAICDSRRNHALVSAAYGALLPQSSPLRVDTAIPLQSSSSQCRVARTADPPLPLVSLVVPYYNLGDYLPDTLASLAAQDYARTEVIVVDDGSTDPKSLEVLSEMKVKYPEFRYETQDNQGLGAARNTGLRLAQGEFFLPVDADNIARPNMVAQFVRALRRNPQLSVATCYHLAFEQISDIHKSNFPYAYRPIGGPFVAAVLRNVYGDANAMFRTSALRSVGGYSTDRDTGYEDWELFVNLARRGHQIDVVPEYLFYYRHRPASMLRTTDGFLNRRRVLRQFFAADELLPGEKIQLWTALASFGEGQRPSSPHVFPMSQTKHRTGLRLAAYRFKTTLHKAPYYTAMMTAFKQWRRRAA